MTIKILHLLLLLGVFLQIDMSIENQKNKKQTKTIKPFPTEICQASTKEELLEKCVGKRVKLKGTISKNILNPDIIYPDVSSAGGYTNQIHIDTDLGQIGLISQKPIKCQERVEIEGILRSMSLFEKKAKDNNKTLYVQVLAFQCN